MGVSCLTKRQVGTFIHLIICAIIHIFKRVFIYIHPLLLVSPPLIHFWPFHSVIRTLIPWSLFFVPCLGLFMSPSIDCALTHLSFLVYWYTQFLTHQQCLHSFCLNFIGSFILHFWMCSFIHHSIHLIIIPGFIHLQVHKAVSLSLIYHPTLNDVHMLGVFVCCDRSLWHILGISVKWGLSLCETRVIL